MLTVSSLYYDIVPKYLSEPYLFEVECPKIMKNKTHFVSVINYLFKHTRVKFQSANTFSKEFIVDKILIYIIIPSYIESPYFITLKSVILRHVNVLQVYYGSQTAS